jgi:hypothetical protein
LLRSVGNGRFTDPTSPYFLAALIAQYGFTSLNQFRRNLPDYYAYAIENMSPNAVMSAFANNVNASPTQVDPSPSPAMSGQFSQLGSITGAANMFKRPAPASGVATVKRHRMEGNMKGINPNTTESYPTVVMRMPENKKPLRSAYKAFKEYFEGVRTLKNSFSFSMTSNKGKRGVMLLPVRHDGVIYGTSPAWGNHTSLDTDANYPWYAGTGGIASITKVQDSPHAHVVGDLYRSGRSPLDAAGNNVSGESRRGNVCVPMLWESVDSQTNAFCDQYAFENYDNIASSTVSRFSHTANLLIPGLSNLHLENASWNLNSLKVVTEQKTRLLGGEFAEDLFYRPLLAYSSLTDACWSYTATGGTSTAQGQADDRTPNNYVSRNINHARSQQLDPANRWGVRVDPADSPSDLAPTRPEQYEIQVGSGEFKMTFKNLGSTQVTIEVVALGVKEKYFGDNTTIPKWSPQFVENMWSWLTHVNGALYEEKAQSKAGKLLVPTHDDSGGDSLPYLPNRSDIIFNPHVNFLPSSTFDGVLKPRLDNNNAKQEGGVAAIETGNGVDGMAMNPQRLNTGSTDINSDALRTTQNNDPLYAATVPKSSPYRDLGRSYLTVPAKGKRTLRIPLPKLRYNPSKDDRFSKLRDDHVIGNGTSNNSIRATPLNPNTITFAISINGSLQDYYTSTTDPLKNQVFLGQDYSESTVFCDCVYTEKTYPAVLEPIEDGTAFNFGRPLEANMPWADDQSLQVFSPVDAAHIVPVFTPSPSQSGAPQCSAPKTKNGDTDDISGDNQ